MAGRPSSQSQSASSGSSRSHSPLASLPAPLITALSAAAGTALVLAGQEALRTYRRRQPAGISLTLPQPKGRSRWHDELHTVLGTKDKQQQQHDRANQLSDCVQPEEHHYHFATLTTRHHSLASGSEHGISAAIHPSTTYRLQSSQAAAELADLQEEFDTRQHGKGYFYSRWMNPNSSAAAEIVSDLEGCAGSVIMSSGMAAISSTFLTILSAGDHFVAPLSVYGGTSELIERYAGRNGWTHTLVDTTNVQNIINAVKPNTKLIYCESPNNPTMRLTDLPTLCQWKIQNRPDIMIASDGTFASPFHTRQLDIQGLDISIQSLTKYMNGHSDVTLGSVSSNNGEWLRKLAHSRKIIGGSPDAFSCFLLVRGMKTLSVRMQRHCENALKIAQYLESHPLIATVFYPGLASHPDHQLARKLMRNGFSGMLCFELKGDGAQAVGAATVFVESLKVINLAVSLGSVESLIIAPAATTHRMVSKEARLAAGISDGLVRFSVGIEHVDDLIADLKQALQQANDKVYSKSNA